MPRPPKGFTLIEILVVVLIIGLLTTILATNLLGRADEAKIQLATTQLRNLERSLELYKIDNGRYPTQDQGLDALVHEPSTEPLPRHYPRGGYLRSDALTDPWGVPFRYRQPGERNPYSFDLYSLGPDGVEGGDGDIVNWESSPS
ncbi:MAG: type II secretion system major pseudopilin GspG [Myxococcota bacterium]